VLEEAADPEDVSELEETICPEEENEDVTLDEENGTLAHEKIKSELKIVRKIGEKRWDDIFIAAPSVAFINEQKKD